jgi:hypothetical protein
MKTLLAVVAFITVVACGSATGPSGLPSLAGVWVYRDTIHISGGCASQGEFTIYQGASDSGNFTGALKNLVKVCNGTSSPLSDLGVRGREAPTDTVSFSSYLLSSSIPLSLRWHGRITDAAHMSGIIDSTGNPAIVSWTAAKQ